MELSMEHAQTVVDLTRRQREDAHDTIIGLQVAIIERDKRIAALEAEIEAEKAKAAKLRKRLKGK